MASTQMLRAHSEGEIDPRYACHCLCSPHLPLQNSKRACSRLTSPRHNYTTSTTFRVRSGTDHLPHHCIHTHLNTHFPHRASCPNIMLKPLEPNLRPFNFEEVLAADRAAGLRNVHIDVGRNSKGIAVPSLERLERKVARCLTNDTKHRLATVKLYISGDWNYAEPEGELTAVSKKNYQIIVASVLIGRRMRRCSPTRKNGKKALMPSASSSAP